MKKTFVFVSAIALTVLLVACDALTADEVGRLPINKVSVEKDSIQFNQTVLELKKGEEVFFWSEMDMEYEGEVLLFFKIQILKDGLHFVNLELDPRDKSISIGEVKTTIMDKTKWSFSGKNASISIKESGKYTFKGILVASDNPTLKINKAEVVIKK